MEMKPLLILIISCAAGFLFHALTPDFPMRGDTFTFYDPIAKNLANGTGFWMNGEPTARVAPAYPFLLSLVYRANGDFKTVQMIQIFLLAGIAVICYFIARKVGVTKNAAFLAALSIALWPYLLFYSKLALTEILFIFFLMGFIYALLALCENPSRKNAFAAGGILALAVLVRPIILLLPIWLMGCAVFILLALRRKNIIAGWKNWLVSFAVFLAILSPWTIRNFIQFDTFIPVTSGLGASLNRAYVTLDYTEGTLPLAPDEAQLKDHIASRLKNVYLFWNPGTQGANAELLLEQNKLFGAAFLVYKLIFILTASLAAFAFFIPRVRPNLILLGLIILYFWAVHTMLYPYPRYTLPIMPLVIILAWISINHLSTAYTSFKKGSISRA